MLRKFSIFAEAAAPQIRREMPVDDSVSELFCCCSAIIYWRSGRDETPSEGQYTVISTPSSLAVFKSPMISFSISEGE
jgi:hypothetical protein